MLTHCLVFLHQLWAGFEQKQLPHESTLFGHSSGILTQYDFWHQRDPATTVKHCPQPSWKAQQLGTGTQVLVAMHLELPFAQVISQKSNDSLTTYGDEQTLQ
jgi:hypothetical protein